MSGYDTLVSRGVTRLCHFTKFQKLCDIICSEQGILATSGITFDTKNVTDSKRLDGKIDYVCCSVQYPNSWYLMKAENNDRDPIFKEWVVIFIDPAVLLYRNAKFSPCNDASLDVQSVQQFRNRGNLIALFFNSFLSQTESAVLTPCCYNMVGLTVIPLVAFHGFSVNANNFLQIDAFSSLKFCDLLVTCLLEIFC